MTEKIDPTDFSFSHVVWVLRTTCGLLVWAEPNDATPQDTSIRHSAIADCINEIYKFGPERTRTFGQFGSGVNFYLMKLAQFVKHRRESAGCMGMILLVVCCGIGTAVAFAQMLT